MKILKIQVFVFFSIFQTNFDEVKQNPHKTFSGICLKGYYPTQHSLFSTVLEEDNIQKTTETAKNAWDGELKVEKMK